MLIDGNAFFSFSATRDGRLISLGTMAVLYANCG